LTIGIPAGSVRTGHSRPSVDRSLGFFPVPSPPDGHVWREPSTAVSDRSRPTIVSEPDLASFTIGSTTPAATHSSRRVRAVVSETFPPHTRSASLRRPARRQHDLAAVSVRLPSSVPAEGVVIEGHRDEEFDRRPDNGSHFRLERPRQWGPPPLVGCGWPDMYVGTNRRLVDGPSWHAIYPGQRLDFLSARSPRPLRSRKAAPGEDKATPQNRCGTRRR